ncbi:MAG: 1-acyl-sn-glycerol-3-phosphate acyltransferase [Woeseiaceae bacterium]|nr:1-acyl-sn-glycerol-3-phosphate acyltransferase [Woeseiaceae bacterium]
MKYVTGLLEGLWSLYAWIVFIVCVLLSLIVVTFVPTLKARVALTTATSRLAFRLSGIRVEVTGLDNLPEGHSVVVANHASYVDGPLLKGFLPARFSFVIKGEMRNIPIVHFLLRRSGSRFVERFTAAGSARDARQIVKAAQGGQSLVFFPEGTFREEPGVGRFRPGAFVAATRGQMPVVPVSITGTREVLKCGHAMLRRRPVRIDILPPIPTDDPAFADHRALAERARQRVLANLGEPDLLGRENETY